jgi:hypothetical protein
MKAVKFKEFLIESKKIEADLIKLGLAELPFNVEFSLYDSDIKNEEYEIAKNFEAGDNILISVDGEIHEYLTDITMEFSNGDVFKITYFWSSMLGRATASIKLNGEELEVDTNDYLDELADTGSFMQTFLNIYQANSTNK